MRPTYSPNPMPRTSEKAQLASQLQNTWLAHILQDMLFDEDELKLLQQFLGSGPIETFHHIRNLSSLANEINFNRATPKNSEWGGLGSLDEYGCEMASGLEKSEEDEEIGEFISFLAMAVQGIRYLAPRVPIPRSNHLFTHHVC